MNERLLICLQDKLSAQALDWCERFGLTQAPASVMQAGQFYLCLDQDGLSLRAGDNSCGRVQVNFSEGAVAHRRKFGGGLGQDIAKAIGVSGAYKPSVVDATAGLGRDSFVLATLGCRVMAQERNPQVAALLADGLARGALDNEIADIVSRISLTFGSSHDLLQPAENPADMPDIVYLDPMFDHDPKQTALVKKDMQAFRHVVGQDTDADDLLDRALACARCRVVVKRARKAAPMAGRKPSYELVGKSNRFDVYVKARVGPVTGQ